MKSKYLIIAGVVLLLIGLAYYFFVWGKKTDAPAPSNSATPPPVPTAQSWGNTMLCTVFTSRYGTRTISVNEHISLVKLEENGLNPIQLSTTQGKGIYRNIFFDPDVEINKAYTQQTLDARAPLEMDICEAIKKYYLDKKRYNDLMFTVILPPPPPGGGTSGGTA